jgi:hypothetical protein
MDNANSRRSMARPQQKSPDDIGHSDLRESRRGNVSHPEILVVRNLAHSLVTGNASHARRSNACKMFTNVLLACAVS